MASPERGNPSPPHKRHHLPHPVNLQKQLLILKGTGGGEKWKDQQKPRAVLGNLLSDSSLTAGQTPCLHGWRPVKALFKATLWKRVSQMGGRLLTIQLSFNSQGCCPEAVPFPNVPRAGTCRGGRVDCTTPAVLPSLGVCRPKYNIFGLLILTADSNLRATVLCPLVFNRF